LAAASIDADKAVDERSSRCPWTNSVDKREARQLLESALGAYRKSTYQELTARIERGVEVRQVHGPSGVEYTIEIETHWDDALHGDVRVAGAIDDGRLPAALVPLCNDFVMTSDGRMLGEN
jgi:hypothetical protein